MTTLPGWRIAEYRHIAKPWPLYATLMKHLLIIGLTLILVACGNNSRPSYFWVSYDDKGNADTTLIKRIEVDSFPSGAKTYFYYTSDTTHYFVRPDTLLGSQINLYKPSNQPLKLFSDTTIVHDADTFHIFKFIENREAVDRVIIHYWETKFGIYAIHSQTRPGLRIFQAKDPIQNRKINFLIRETIPKFFLSDKILSDITQ